MAIDISELLKRSGSLEHTLAKCTLEERLALIEFIARSSGPSIDTAKAEPSTEKQREALRRFLEKMEGLPVENPNDGLFNRDHDKLLYGKPS